jgi:hypothetical protein
MSMEVHLSTRMEWSGAKRNVPTGHGRSFPGAIHTHGGLGRQQRMLPGPTETLVSMTIQKRASGRLVGQRALILRVILAS